VYTTHWEDGVGVDAETMDVPIPVCVLGPAITDDDAVTLANSDRHKYLLSPTMTH